MNSAAQKILVTVLGGFMVLAVGASSAAIVRTFKNENNIKNLRDIHDKDVSWMKEILVDMKEVYKQNKGKCNGQ